MPLTMKTVATPPWRTAQARHKSVLNRSFRPPVNCPIARCQVKQWSPFFDEISNARLYPQGLPDDLSGAIFIGRTALLTLRRNYTHWKITSPKSGENRRVDMSRELARTLATLHTERQVETAASTWETMPEWVFCSEVGGAPSVPPRDHIFYG